MATLDKKHKEFIVKQLACFTSPKDIIAEAKEQFGVEVTSQQITYYNPESVQGSAQLADKWQRLHSETRDKFIEGAIQIPITHKMYRLQVLQQMLDKNMDDSEEVRAILEQAAKEMGGAYEDIKGKIGELAENSGVTIYQQLNQKFTQINNNG